METILFQWMILAPGQLAGYVPADISPPPTLAQIAGPSLIAIAGICFLGALIVGVAVFAIQAIKRNRVAKGHSVRNKK